MKGTRILPFLLCVALTCFETVPQNLYLFGTSSLVGSEWKVDGRLLALLDSELASLRNLACTRAVARFYRKEPGGPLHRIDVIGAVGGYVNGQDEETPVTRNGRQLGRSMRELKGSWSTGEFGAILAEEAAAIASGTVALKVSEAGDAYEIRYEVPASISAWDLQISGRHWRPGYVGSISISKESNRIIRVTRAVDEIAPECPVGRFAWQVEYEMRVINERPVSVPVRAHYENCERASGRCAVNDIVFSNFREFRTDSIITFAEARPVAVPGGTGKASGALAPSN
jgi:hypothetical protein